MATVRSFLAQILARQRGRAGLRHHAAGTVLGLATIATGLTGGLLYAYACSVMPGLARTDDRTFITAMQEINKAIQNPIFFASFFGALILTAVALVQQRRLEQRAAQRWVTAGLALYLLTLFITIAFNIPLNDDLAFAGAPARIADPAAIRDHFEGSWIAWNIVRTTTATVALSCLARALVLHGRQQAERPRSALGKAS
jgi:uncharacterized membrane protein